MNLSEHFTLEELTFSDTAQRLGISNVPNEAALQNLTRTAKLLEEIRTLLRNNPLHINSGYRGPELNAKIGGSKTSAHMEGRAADFTCSAVGTPLSIAKTIYYSDLLNDCDQVIFEGTWLHVAVPKEGVAPRRQVLTAHFSNGKVTYTEGL